MSKYEIIAFDLDGTLSDPAHGLLDGFVYAFKKLCVDYGERESLRRFIGPPLAEEWQRAFGFTAEEAERAVELFREYYNVYGWWDNTLYVGITELLADLKKAGKTIVLSTSKPQDTAEDILRLHKLYGYFDFISGHDYVARLREKKWEVLEYALENLGIDHSPEARAKCVLVGDRMYDAEGAEKCGIDSIGVLWGHGSLEELSRAGFTHVVKTVGELEKILL
ncbi:MAG: HAD hydrolase-like protein [Clostridia bacterium]|nr:HAD hydrolase-like protein [Clostridia bacterium]